MKLYLLTFVFSICCMVSWCEQDYLVTNEDLESFSGRMETLVHFDNVKTINREKVFNGTWEISEDMDNEHFKFSIELFSSPKGDGDYKRLAMGVPNTAICDGFKKFYVQFVEPCMVFNENTNFPIVGDKGLCPIPKGVYFVKEIALDTESWPSQVPRGIIKCVITFYKNDVPVGGTNIIIKIEDKE